MTDLTNIASAIITLICGCHAPPSHSLLKVRCRSCKARKWVKVAVRKAAEMIYHGTGRGLRESLC